MKSFQQLNHFDTDEQIDGLLSFTKQSVYCVVSVFCVVLVFLIFVTVPLSVFGKGTASSRSQQPIEDDRGPSKKISGSLSLGRTNSLYVVNGVSEVSSWDFSMETRYQASNSWAFTTLVDGYRDLKNPEESDFGRGRIGTLYQGWVNEGDHLAWIPSFTVGLPISKAARQASLQSQLIFAIATSVNSRVLFSDKLSLSFGLSGVRNIHQFETGLSGKMNTRESSSQSMNLGWSFTDSLSISGSLFHFNKWSYGGTMTESYAHKQELRYTAGKHWAGMIGHLFGNPEVSVWKPNGQEYYFNVSDEKNSLVYATIEFIF